MTYAFLIIVVVAILAVLGVAAFTNFEVDDLHYDRLKWIVGKGHYIVVFVGLLVKTFGFPYGAETVTVVAGIFALFAGILDISSKNYYATRSTHEMTDEEAFDALAEYDDLYDEMEAYEDKEDEEEAGEDEAEEGDEDE